MGEDRARDELRTDILRRVERAANRKREADIDCDQAIDRAARLGLSHREIATAAQVTHGTAILTRSDATAAAAQPSATEHSEVEVGDEPRTESLAT
ncbi:MAG: hypothetical protein ACXVH3_35215 [Solirubrobacteraceae bacterium]